MSGYNGGRRNGVNVSQFIANLNKEPSPFEVARSEEQKFNVDDEGLAQFTNAEFFDFDGTDFLNESNGAVDGLSFNDDNKAEKREPDGEKTSNGLDFVNGSFPLQAVNPFDVDNALPQQPQQQQQRQQQQQPPPQPPTLFPDYASQPPLPAYQTTSPTTSTAFPAFPSQTASTTAITASHASPTDSTSDPARALAEEDKRRRNTAASARFRVKKKQREQALEQKTQELEKAKQALEQRVGQLETENEWLRGLVVEKNGGKGKGKDQKGVESETDSEKEKKGVGTKA